MINRLDSHTHTIASGHAFNTIFEMAQAAAEKKLELLAITEHTKSMPGACNDLYFHNLKVLPRTLFGIEVLFGAEVNILDFEGTVDLPQKLLARLDVVIASLHKPCIAPGTKAENTQALVKAIENPYVNLIGHPDDGRYPVDFDTLAAAASEHHKLLELNNSSQNPVGSRTNAREADIQMLEACRKYGTSIILNSDAHWAGEIGSCCYTMPLLEELSFPETLVVNRSLEEYKKYINRYREDVPR